MVLEKMKMRNVYNDVIDIRQRTNFDLKSLLKLMFEFFLIFHVYNLRYMYPNKIHFAQDKTKMLKIYIYHYLQYCSTVNIEFQKAYIEKLQ